MTDLSQLTDAFGTLATATQAALDAVATRPPPLGIYNALDNGVKGGGADDTVALKAMFAAMATSSAHQFYLPDGEYLAGDTLDIPYTQYRRLFGAGWGASIIKMTANNKPIIRASYEDTHSITLENLSLMYGTQQVSANTASGGLLFTAAPGVGDGFYFWAIRNLVIAGAAVGIGIGGTGSTPVWGSVLDTVLIERCATTAINLASPTTIGMPAITMRDIKVRNTGSDIASSAAALILSGVEAGIDGLDIEGWHGLAVYNSGGAPVTMRNVHVEHHTLTGTDPKMFLLADGPITMDGVIVDATSTGTGVVSIFYLQNAGTTLRLAASDAKLDATGGSGYSQEIGGASDAKAFLTGCAYTATPGGTGAVHESLPSGFGPSLYSRVSVDGMPPVVDALPTPSATYRGRRFRMLGGTGAADVVSECAKNAAGAYAWVTK